MTTNGDSKARVIYIRQVDDITAHAVIPKLVEFEMDDPKEPIRVILNTPGGEAAVMFALYDILKVTRCPIVTVGIGKIMSAGVLLLAAGKKGERRMARNATVMMHEISSATWGKLYEMETDVEETKRLQGQYERLMALETGKGIKEVQKVFAKHKDVYMTAAEAKKFGIVDKVV